MELGVMLASEDNPSKAFSNIVSHLKKNGYIIQKSDGAYYPFSEEPKYYNFNITFDNQYITGRSLTTFIKKRKIPPMTDMDIEKYKFVRHGNDKFKNIKNLQKITKGEVKEFTE